MESTKNLQYHNRNKTAKLRLKTFIPQLCHLLSFKETIEKSVANQTKYLKSKLKLYA